MLLILFHHLQTQGHLYLGDGCLNRVQTSCSEFTKTVLPEFRWDTKVVHGTAVDAYIFSIQCKVGLIYR
jgi:hypothetical protein